MIKKTIGVILCMMAVIFTMQTSASANSYDVNGDGKVTVKDATDIQRYLAELDDPVCDVRIEDVASKYKTAEAKFVSVLLSEEICDGQGFMIVDSHDLTDDIINSRTDHDILLVERVIGIVVNDDGDGRVLNTIEENRHISYKYIYEKYRVGTVIATYYIYHPCTAGGDIVNRYDYVIDREYEEW